MKKSQRNKREKKTSRRGKMLMMNDKRNNNLEPDADWLLLLAGHRSVPFVTKKRNNIAPAHATFFSMDVHT
jgi:hypothetical protein